MAHKGKRQTKKPRGGELLASYIILVVHPDVSSKVFPPVESCWTSWAIVKDLLFRMHVFNVIEHVKTPCEGFSANWTNCRIGIVACIQSSDKHGLLFCNKIKTIAVFQHNLAIERHQTGMQKCDHSV